MLKLYQYDSAIDEILSGKVDMETGELLTDENGEILIDIEALNNLQMEKNEKLRHCGLAWLSKAAEIKAIKDEITRLQKMLKKAEKSNDWLLKYIETYSGGEEHKFTEFSIKYSESKVAEVDAEFIEWAKKSKAGKQFLRIKYEADKPSITAAIKSGKTVKHASLTTKRTMKIK